MLTPSPKKLAVSIAIALGALLAAAVVLVMITEESDRPTEQSPVEQPAKKGVTRELSPRERERSEPHCLLKKLAHAFYMCIPPIFCSRKT
jgi:hypothetical protein